MSLVSTTANVKLCALGDRDLRYVSHREVDATLGLLGQSLDCRWVGTESDAARDLDGVDGIWLLPGTPYRDEEAALASIRHCLETGTPFLGSCGGFQYSCLELARLAGVFGAAHAERAPTDAANLVIVPLACELYGERRLVQPLAGTHLAEICGSEPFYGFHWCGYGLSDAYTERLRAAGVVISATAPDAGVEAIELTDHQFFMATAFQPQVGSSESGRLHPLIEAFAEAARGAASRRVARTSAAVCDGVRS